MIGLTASDLQNVRPALGPLKHNLVVSSIASGLFLLLLALLRACSFRLENDAVACASVMPNPA
ncbi:MAG: hypothetical protein DME23_23600 [Verrucomicrobia bacterium]|nr:MAG: hypothetical protein DME23_23600 [Verrucomicrobiota bacterium]